MGSRRQTCGTSVRVLASRLRSSAAPHASNQAWNSAFGTASDRSGDGEKVTNFADAAALLAEGEQVDYDGASGPITLDENGDPTEATIGIYEYADDNTYTRIG